MADIDSVLTSFKNIDESNTSVFWDFLYTIFITKISELNPAYMEKIIRKDKLIEFSPYEFGLINFADLNPVEYPKTIQTVLNQIEDIDIWNISDYFSETILSDKVFNFTDLVDNFQKLLGYNEIIALEETGKNLSSEFKEYKLIDKYSKNLEYAIKIFVPFCGNCLNKESNGKISGEQAQKIIHSYCNNSQNSEIGKIYINIKNKCSFELKHAFIFVENIYDMLNFIRKRKREIEDDFKYTKINFFEKRNAVNSIIKQVIGYKNHVSRLSNKKCPCAKPEFLNNFSFSKIPEIINRVFQADKNIFKDSISRVEFQRKGIVIDYKNYDFENIDEFLSEFINAFSTIGKGNFSYVETWMKNIFVMVDKNQRLNIIKCLKSFDYSYFFKEVIKKFNEIKRIKSSALRFMPPKIIMVPGSGDYFVYDDSSNYFIAPTFFNRLLDLENSVFNAFASYRYKADNANKSIREIYGPLFTQYDALRINKNLSETQKRKFFINDYALYIKTFPNVRLKREGASDRALKDLRNFFRDNF